MRNSIEEGEIIPDDLTNTDSKSPDAQMNIDDESPDNQRINNSDQSSPTLITNEAGEFQKPKKKRKKAPLTMPNKKYTTSKSLMSLPSNLSEFSWIENTELNVGLLEEEKAKQQDLRRQKEEQKRIRTEFSIQLKAETDIIQEQTVKVEEDLPLKQEVKVEETKEIPKDQPYEYFKTKDILSLDDIYERVDYA